MKQALKPAGHGHIIFSKTCSKLQNDSIEDTEVDNRLEKEDFAYLLKNANFVARFSSFRQFRIGENDVTYRQPDCQANFKMTASEVPSFQTNF